VAESRRAPGSSRARVAVIAWAGLNRLVGGASLLPQAINTAIVSPSARPKPKSDAATSPRHDAGSVTRHKVVTRSAPKAKLASVKVWGTALSASQATAITVGSAMSAKSRPPFRRRGRWAG
jgi:hypothetical protein